MNYSEMEKKRSELEKKFDEVQQEVKKEVKNLIDDITNRLRFLLDDVSQLKSNSVTLSTDLKKNRIKHKQAFEEIKESLEKIENIVVVGRLDDIETEIFDLESDFDISKKASISDLIENISKKLYESL